MQGFPNEGEFFGVKCSYMNDHSYRSDIFECIGSDESRVVCMRRTPGYGNDKPMILHRSEWNFEDVSAILPSLGFCNKKESERIASEVIAKATGAQP